LKRIEFSSTPSTGVGQTRSPGTMQSSLTNDQMDGSMLRQPDTRLQIKVLLLNEKNLIWMSCILLILDVIKITLKNPFKSQLYNFYLFNKYMYLKKIRSR